MIGLYFFFLLGSWGLLVAWLSVTIARKLPASKWRPLVEVGLFIFLLPLVLIDEIVGKYQFEQLCHKNSAIYIAPDARGRTVYLVNTPVEVIKGTWVKIVLQPWRYVDATTGERVVNYNSLRARGGWFISIFYGEGGPLIFKGSCRPPNPPINIEMFRNIGINRIEHPILKFGESK